MKSLLKKKTGDVNQGKKDKRKRGADMQNIRSLLFTIIAAVLLCACGPNDKGQVMDGDGMI